MASRRSEEPESWWLTSWSRWPGASPGKRSWRSGAAAFRRMPLRKRYGLRRCQGFPHRGRLVLDDQHIGAHRRFRFASPLLPLLNGPPLEPVAFRELLARQPLSFADSTNIDVGHDAHDLHWKFDFAPHVSCDLFGRINQYATKLSALVA